MSSGAFYPSLIRRQLTARQQGEWTPGFAPALEFGRAFTQEKRRELKKAKIASMMKRIVKIKTMLDGSETPYKHRGRFVEVKRFPFLGSPKGLSEYGCSVAVNLYLQFQTECGFLFIMMMLLSLPKLHENYQRSSIRMSCRALTRSNASYALVTQGIDSDECGWEGLPIQQGIMTLADWYLGFATGTCQEYTWSAQSTIPITRSAEGEPPKFVHTPNAAYCQGSGTTQIVAFWLQFVAVLFFFLFLIRVRRMQRSAAMRLDRALWTAADYSVLITGLDCGVAADDQSGALGLENRVYADLENLGFSRKQIVQVAIGRECAQEVKELKKLKALRVREQEMRAKRRSRLQKGQPEMTDKMKKESEKMDQAISDVMARLDACRETPDKTTGHAFVVFLYEKDRNRLVKETKIKWLDLLPRQITSGLYNLIGLKRPRAWWESSSGRQVTVAAAPEPDDVKWENLQLNDSYTACQATKTFLITLLLLAVGLVLMIGAKVFQSRVRPADIAAVFTSFKGYLGVSQRRYLIEGANLVISMIAALITTLVNLLLKLVITKMTASEGVDTETAYQSSLFAKLSLAYTFNSAIVPLAIGVYFSYEVLDWPVNQSWYEAGGVVNQAIFLIMSNAIVKSMLTVMQPWTMVKRYVFAPFVVSQQKLNELWEPPDMHLGELYAGNLKTLALCLLYAPLWPPAYALTAIVMFIDYWCTKFAICYWFKKPPMVSEDMMDKFRSRLGLLMLLHTVVAMMGAKASSATSDPSVFSLGPSSSYPVVAMLLAWLVYELIDVPDCLSIFPCLRHFNELKSGAGEDRAMKLRDVPCETDRDKGKLGVKEKLGYDIDKYVCPADKRYAIDFLLDHSFRGFGDGDHDVASDGADVENFISRSLRSRSQESARLSNGSSIELTGSKAGNQANTGNPQPNPPHAARSVSALHQSIPSGAPPASMNSTAATFHPQAVYGGGCAQPSMPTSQVQFVHAGNPFPQASQTYQQVTIAPTTQREILVQIPTGVAGGQPLLVNNPFGGQMQVTVPHGMAAGQAMRVVVPANPSPTTQQRPLPTHVLQPAAYQSGRAVGCGGCFSNGQVQAAHVQMNPSLHHLHSSHV